MAIDDRCYTKSKLLDSVLQLNTVQYQFWPREEFPTDVKTLPGVWGVSATARVTASCCA
jgi:hypothetical protein